MKESWKRKLRQKIERKKLENQLKIKDDLIEKFDSN